MSDAIDQANDHAEQTLQRALDKHRNRAITHVHQSPYCDECGDEINPARKAALPSAIYCVECQHITEQQQRGFRHDY